jgi:two-component system sensor histidine kinase PilS (NtrC family)
MTVPASSATSSSPSASHWISLRYFNVYRLCIAGLLFATSFFQLTSYWLVGPEHGLVHLVLTGTYLFETSVSLLVLYFSRQRFNRHLSVDVLCDVLILTLLMHTEGGLRSGLGALLLVSLAGAGLVGQGRLVLFYAASATVAVLAEQSYRSLIADVEVVDFFQTGLFCAGFFAVAISARHCQRRVGEKARH